MAGREPTHTPPGHPAHTLAQPVLGGPARRRHACMHADNRLFVRLSRFGLAHNLRWPLKTGQRGRSSPGPTDPYVPRTRPDARLYTKASSLPSSSTPPYKLRDPLSDFHFSARPPTKGPVPVRYPTYACDHILPSAPTAPIPGPHRSSGHQMSVHFLCHKLTSPQLHKSPPANGV